MKKRLYLICLLCLFGISTIQLKAQTRHQFGIRIAPELTSITSIGGEGKLGFVGGVYANFKISKRHFSVQPELLFSQKGDEKKGSIQGVPVTQKIRLAYLEIPVLVKYTFNPDGLFQPNIYVGPYAGFKINAKGTTKTSNDQKTISLGSQTNVFDFGVVAGAGLAV